MIIQDRVICDVRSQVHDDVMEYLYDGWGSLVVGHYVMMMSYLFNNIIVLVCFFMAME